MKNLIYILLIGLLSLSFSNTRMQCKNSTSKFKMVTIDSIETVYIIYAERNDSIFKIVSHKEGANGCRTLSKGNFYELKIKSLLENLAGKRHIGGVKYAGVMIMLEGDNKIQWDLFVSENIKGLCFIPQSTKK